MLNSIKKFFAPRRVKVLRDEWPALIKLEGHYFMEDYSGSSDSVTMVELHEKYIHSLLRP